PVREISFKGIIPGRHQILFGIFFEVNLLYKGGQVLGLVLGEIGFETEDWLVRIFLYVLLRHDHVAKVGKAYSLGFNRRKLLRGSGKCLWLRIVSGRGGHRFGITGRYSDENA